MTVEIPLGESHKQLLSQAEFETFCDFFYHRTGIFFVQTKRFYVDRRLIDRMSKAGFDSIGRYLHHLRSLAGEGEIQQLINELTVNETYFFREKSHFDCMVRSVLPEIVRAREESREISRPIRIWVMPCSTGEEAYSVALYLLEYWPQIDEIDVEIVASDIDTNVLKRCEAGVYSARSVQQLPDPLRRKYFTATSDNMYLISRDLVESVSFLRNNLVDPESNRRFRGFDIVFCRNLFIYFDSDSRRKASQGIFDALNRGGYLFLGQMESIGKVSGLFDVERKPESLVYRRPK